MISLDAPEADICGVGVDSMEKYLKRLVYKAEASSKTCVVGRYRSAEECSESGVVEVSQRTKPEAVEKSPKRCWQACQV